MICGASPVAALSFFGGGRVVGVLFNLGGGHADACSIRGAFFALPRDHRLGLFHFRDLASFLGLVTLDFGLLLGGLGLFAFAVGNLGLILGFAPLLVGDDGLLLGL